MSNISLDLKILSYKKAGIGRYCINLSQQLLKRNKFKFFGISGPETDTNILHSMVLNSKINLPIKSSLIRSFIVPFLLPKKIELHHSMDNSGIINFKTRIKKITTIHDVLVFLYPEYFSLKHRTIVSNLIKMAVKSSDHIITDSISSKNELLSIFSKINPENISVIPLAANIKQLNSKSDKSVHNLYGIPSNYLLSVGTFEPRKNLARLIESFLELKHSQKLQDVGLVLVGGKGWLDSGVGSDKEDLNKKGIFPIGFVEDEFLPYLYSNAMAFIYPSIHEGFGLPPLEAMSCGSPVILSNSSSLPEVGGDAVLYVDPFSVESIKEAIERIVYDDELRKSMAKKSLKQSQKFSWDRTAELTEEVYAKVLEL